MRSHAHGNIGLGRQAPTTHKTCTCDNNAVARQRQSNQYNSYFSEENEELPYVGRIRTHFLGKHSVGALPTELHLKSSTKHNAKENLTLLSLNVYACISYCGYILSAPCTYNYIPATAFLHCGISHKVREHLSSICVTLRGRINSAPTTLYCIKCMLAGAFI